MICIDDICDYLIINFWWGLNYGANLTAYAIQELIKSFGYTTKLLNAGETEREEYQNSFAQRFADKFLDITKPHSLNSAHNICKNIRGVIVGSDQVFNIGTWNNIDHLNKNLANFADVKNQKIALSVSFGVDKNCFAANLRKKTGTIMKNSLSSFDYLSCREVSGVEIFKEIFNVNGEMILDPVFLIDPKKYDKIMDSSQICADSKVASYVLDTNNDYEAAYKYLEHKYKEQIIKLKNVEIADWLKVIKDCKYLITDSFHGVCFALIFHKPFICVKNLNRGGARFDTLIELFNIKSNFISSIREIYTYTIPQTPDYDFVEQVVVTQKARCLSILTNVLSRNCSEDIQKRKKLAAKMYFKNKKIKIRNNSFIEDIFSVKNEYKKDVKRKVVTVLGVRTSFKV